jgi:hypothetical protein
MMEHLVPVFHSTSVPIDGSSYSQECVESVFCELRLYGVLRSWLRGSAGGIMLVVEGQIPL